MGYNLLLFGSKRIDLDFTNGVLPSGVTFERASSATYFDSSGVLQTAAVDEPLFDYDPSTLASRGILIEPQASNLLLSANDMTTADWTTWTSIIEKSATELFLDDVEYFNVLKQPTGTVQPKIRQTVTGLTISNSYTFSAYVKYKDMTFLKNVIWDGTTNYFVMYNLSTGELGNYSSEVSPGIQDCGGGVYRIYYTVALASGSSLNSVFYLAQGNDTTAAQSYYTGDGVSGSYIGGCMFEDALDSLLPSSYIPTTDSVVSRAAPALSFSIPSGVGALRYTFDDDSTQDVSVTSGAYTVPTTLNRPHIKRILS